MDELLKVEEAKQSTANFMIPERDTTNIDNSSKAKVTGMRSKLRTEARVDTWMKKRRDMMKATGAKIGEKENVPQKRQKVRYKIVFVSSPVCLFILFVVILISKLNIIFFLLD